MPEEAAPGHVGETIRILRHRLEQGLPLTVGQQERWERLVEHNRHDCAGMRQIEPVTEAQARIAREAYRDFGKGSGHAAGLNFGDCFAYALTKVTGESLLFKGDDFSRTDIVAAA